MARMLIHQGELNSKRSPEMYFIIEDELVKNDELTSPQLKRILTSKYPSLEVSLPTITRAWQDLGWVSTRSHYCQLICEVSIPLTVYKAHEKY